VAVRLLLVFCSRRMFAAIRRPAARRFAGSILRAIVVGSSTFMVVPADTWRRTGSILAHPEPLENIVSRDKLDFTSFDMRQTTADLEPPRLIEIRVPRTVERIDKRASHLGPARVGMLRGLPVDVIERGRHARPPSHRWCQDHT